MPRKGGKRAKSKAKSKAKKEARKAALEEEQRRRNVVKAAKFEADGRTVRNVLADFAPFAKFNRNGLDLVVEFAHPSTMTEAEKDWVLSCTRDNMQDMYIDGGWGWNDADKRRELVHEEARHLLVRKRVAATKADEGAEDAKADSSAATDADSSKKEEEEGKAEAAKGELVAFVHFRFLLEGDYSVLYVQEIQLTPPVQRCGLGKQLMQTLELIARKNGVQWVMLTVFKENEAAVQFYMKKLKYTLDDSSPDNHYANQEFSYLILSKCLDPALAKEIAAARAADED